MMRMHPTYWLLVFTTARAMATSDFIPIYEKAMGQSLTGSYQVGDSIHSNPAASAFYPMYSLDATMLFPKTMGASVVDTRTSSLGGGLAYFRKKVSYSDDVVQGGKLLLSARVSQILALGMTAKMLWGPTASGTNDNVKDIDVGALAAFQSFTIGATIRNAFQSSPAFGQERELALGGSLRYQNMLVFALTGHARWETMSPYQLSVGMEYISPNYFGLKGGFRRRFDTGNSYWSVGASLLAPRLTLNYAVEFLPASEGSMEHMVSASLLL